MIQVQRPQNGPTGLLVSGKRQTQADCAAYDAGPGDFHSGEAKFPRREYYREKEVKDLLVEIYQGKCCYCERKFLEIDDLDVEHFRPKGGFRQSFDQKIDELPGYYWLAYDWENLLLSCRSCNQRYKKTFFPLENPAERARSHHDDFTRERPWFVDPVRQDPREHIDFVDDAPRGLTLQGQKTIDGLGLCRAGLKGERRNWLDAIRKSYEVLKLARAHPEIPELWAMAEEEREFIRAAMRPDAKFSSMVIDYVNRHPL
jgi:uncharacterized protein (TIGR02646 family)